MKWRWGTKKQDSPVRVENGGVGTAQEIVSLRFFGLTSVSTVKPALNSFVTFATGQFQPKDAIINNNGNISRQINPKHTFVSYVFSFFRKTCII